MMKKQDFKKRMGAYRKLISSAAWKSAKEYQAAVDSDTFAESFLRPLNRPVVSRRVLRHLFTVGGLDAVRHIDSVAIRYN